MTQAKKLIGGIWPIEKLQLIVNPEKRLTRISPRGSLGKTCCKFRWVSGLTLEPS